MKTLLALSALMATLVSSWSAAIFPNVVYNQSTKAVSVSGLQFTNLSTKASGVSNLVTLENIAIEFVSPDMFGAVPDGETAATDNSVALQRWLNYLQASNKRTRGWIPGSGIYNYGTPLVATNGGITIEGVGSVGNLGGGQWSGSHLRYTGTTGYALVIGHTNATANEVRLNRFRLSGVYGQNPHADGLLIQNCSVSEVNDVQINGAFTNGLTINNSTLIKFDHLLVSACTNAIRIMSTHTGSEFAASAGLTFNMLDIYQCSVGFLVESTCSDVHIQNSFIERTTNAFKIAPASTEASISVYDWNISETQIPTGTAWASESRLLNIDLTGTNSFSITKFAFRNGWSWNEGTSYAVTINTGTNSRPFQTLRNIIFENWTGSGAQTAFLTNDFAFAQIDFLGVTTAMNGFIDGGSAVPLTVGAGYSQSWIQQLGSVDAGNSGPWLLPTNSAATVAAGQFGFDASANRPRYYNGSAQKTVASMDDVNTAVTGTSGKIAKFTGANSVGNSTLVSESGNQLQIGTQSSLKGMLNIAGGDVHIIDTGANDRALVFWKADQQMFAMGDYNNGVAFYMGTNTSPSLVINTNGNDMYFPLITASKILGLSGAGKVVPATLSGLTFNGTTLTSIGAFPIVNKATTYLITTNDYTIICDTTSGSFAVTLPAASALSGKVFNIKKVSADGNTLTITPDGSDTIDGAASKTTTTQYATFQIQSNGASAWWIIN